LLEAAAARAVATHSGARAEPVTVPGADAVAALQLEGTCLSMMYELDLAVIAATAGIATLAAVYLWSKDPGRQHRAWKLLKLMLRR
jgi:hypothetical protein